MRRNNFEEAGITARPRYVATFNLPRPCSGVVIENNPSCGIVTPSVDHSSHGLTFSVKAPLVKQYIVVRTVVRAKTIFILGGHG